MGEFTDIFSISQDTTFTKISLFFSLSTENLEVLKTNTYFLQQLQLLLYKSKQLKQKNVSGLLGVVMSQLSVDDEQFCLLFYANDRHRLT